MDPIIKAGLGHLWFVTLHSFDDGNGRIARALADMFLARAEQSNQRFYSMSAQIRRERNTYYTILEKTQKGSLDITEWLLWFLDCLHRAIQQSDETLGNILKKALFWQKNADLTLNERQKKIINRLFDGFEGKLTSSKWAKLSKCSQDSANRDILDLLEKKVLIKQGAGRSTHYILKTDE
jgi:Fic family protein